MDSDYSYDYVSSEDPEYQIDYLDTNDIFADQDIFNHLDNDETHNLDESTTKTSHSAPPEVANDDDSVAFSTSINQTRNFLQQVYGVPISSFRNHDIPGLIILRIQDISSLRNDAKKGLRVPHLLFHPTEDNPHPELMHIFETLNKN